MSPDTTLPAGTQGTGLQGALRTHNVGASGSGAGAEGGEGLVSCQGLRLPLHVAAP